MFFSNANLRLTEELICYVLKLNFNCLTVDSLSWLHFSYTKTKTLHLLEFSETTTSLPSAGSSPSQCRSSGWIGLRTSASWPTVALQHGFVKRYHDLPCYWWHILDLVFCLPTLFLIRNAKHVTPDLMPSNELLIKANASHLSYVL